MSKRLCLWVNRNPWQILVETLQCFDSSLIPTQKRASRSLTRSFLQSVMGH